MDSQIELYPHNQTAYDKLCKMLEVSDRACVVQPTGTGKFVIIAKLVQDNPKMRFLLLGTNEYMFADQMANLADFAPGFTPENLQFMTYAAAMVAARNEVAAPKCDVIIADEFHHCGAPEWGKGVQYVIESNPEAKVIGFTATPIRYSDNGRNMADEMFEGNVASSMELEEAWLRGILPIPKYIIALYDAPKELGELKVSIDKVREKKKHSKFIKKYEELRRSLQDADGIDRIIAKHLKKRDGSGVSRSARSGQATKGFHFHYIDDSSMSIRPSRTIPVICVETGKKYDSITDAALAMGQKTPSNIIVALKSGGKSGGYHWRFADVERPVPPFKKERWRAVMCCETGETFRSASAAARSMGFSASSVWRALKSGGTSGGYHWKYVDSGDADETTA